MVINKSKSESLRAKYDLDIEQLDYKFIQQCNTVKTIESILKVLRSGEEGVYPGLVSFTEERLRALKPDSSLLRTERHATTLRALNCEVQEELLSDLRKWKHEVSTADAELKSMSAKSDISQLHSGAYQSASISPSASPSASPISQLPPVRGTVQLIPAVTRDPSPAPLLKPARIPSYDYACWDRYDVEAQLERLDASETAAAPEQPTGHGNPAIDDQLPLHGLSDAERSMLALRERQKGNEYFRSGDFSRAAVYYTRSINTSPTAAAFNNRAQVNLKLGRHGLALLDCGAVLRREPRNAKALLRRGLAHQMNRDWIKARADFQRVLQMEPNNPQARQRLDEVDRAIIGSETKRSKLLIQEVDSIEEEDAMTPAAVDCDDPSDVDGLSPAAPQDTDVAGGHATDMQKEAKRAECERLSESELRLRRSTTHDFKNQPMLAHVNISNVNNTEEVLVNATYKRRKAQNGNSSDVTVERSEEQAICHEIQKTTLTFSQSPKAKSSLNNPQISMDFTADIGGQDPPIDSPRQMPSWPAEDDDVRHRHLTVPLPPGGAVTAASPPRRWRPAEFLHAWRSACRSRDGLVVTAALLRSVAPHQLPQLLGSELNSAILSTVIR